MKILLTTTALLMSTMLAGTASEGAIGETTMDAGEAVVAGIDANDHAGLHAHHSEQAGHHAGLHAHHAAQAEHHAGEAERLHDEASAHEVAAEEETQNENHVQAENHAIEAEKLHAEASGHEDLSDSHEKQAEHHAAQAEHHAGKAEHHAAQLGGAEMGEGVSVADVKEELLHEAPANSGEMHVEAETSIEPMEEVVE